MTRFQLLLTSLRFYWRTNLAVVLGVVAGTAVIGGALVVGDSVRASLREMTLVRLGGIDFALSGHRFFREDLGSELAAAAAFSERFESVAPGLAMTGGLQVEIDSAATGSDGDGDADRTGRSRRTLRAGKVSIWGLDERLWNFTRPGDVAPPLDDEIVLNRRLADELSEQSAAGPVGVKPGDRVTVSIELPASIPRDALLGKRSETTREIVFTVRAILDEDSPVGRLGLSPNQQLPLNAFVSLRTLQENLDLSRIEPTRRNPAGRAAKVNALFVRAKREADRESAAARDGAATLSDLLDAALRPDDIGLRVAVNETRGYLSLESEQQILEEGFAAAGREAAKALGLSTSPVFVYLANEMSKPGNTQDYSRYSIVAGLDLPTEPPFGPFEFVGEPPRLPLGEGAIATGGPGEILLTDWLAEDLDAKPGDVIRMTWHVVGSHGELPEPERPFLVKGIVQLDGTPADDRGLTPEVKGITDVESFDDWDAPFEMKKVTNRDDDYWHAHRATPKAYVSLKTAQTLWPSRYGRLTSFRVSMPDGKSPEEGAGLFTAEVLRRLGPGETGLAFQSVKFDGLQAASGTTDFSMLFIGFSFFLILSAAILIGLLFRLGIERRAAHIGLLEAVGLSPGQVGRLFLTEGLLLVVVGGVLGTAAAVAYASLMIHGLKTWWIGAIGTRFLNVAIEPASLAYGFAGSALVAAFAAWWGLRQLKRVAPRDLLAGATEAALTSSARSRRVRRAGKAGVALVLAAVALLAGVLSGAIPESEAFSGISWTVVCFFLVGMALLAASLSLLSAWLDGDRALAVRGGGLVGVGRLGMKNAARQRQRSVLTVGLIASAAFVLTAVAAGHRNPSVEDPVKNSGNGGFLLVAESSSPILYDLATADGRRKLDLEETAADDEAVRNADLLRRMWVVPFRVKPGDDASCLNIYRTRVPTLLGVPLERMPGDRFKFSGVRTDDPWTLLGEALPDEGGVPTYPVFGDMNTLQYSLKKGVGDTIGVPDDEHPQYRLKVAGMLDGSVFQGVLLLSEANFLKVAPERVGSQYFLIGDRRFEAADGHAEARAGDSGDGSTDKENDATAPLSRGEVDRLRELLESKLEPFGFDAERVADRLASFLAVQNTYLSTFQTLGGLGLLLGTLGLAIVMLRNVLERREELALLRAVGFRNGRLAELVLTENAFLLGWGLLTGTGAALLAMTPHLRSIGGDVPWGPLLAILGGVCVAGMLAAVAAVREAVRTPIVATLRGE